MKTTAILALGLTAFAGLLSGCNSHSSAVLGMSVPPPQSDKGLIVFYRQPNLLDVTKPYAVQEDHMVVGRLSNSTYLAYYAEPGTHLYSVPDAKLKGKTLEIVGGMTYFMEVTKGKGDAGAQPRMRVASLREAQAALKGLSYVDGTGQPTTELAIAR